MARAARRQDATARWPCARERCSWGWRRNAAGGTGAPSGRLAPVPSARAERRTIVSESRVHVSDETEDAPVTGGEVGEADVIGEVDEPEEPYEADETDEPAGDADVTGEADLAADGADATGGADTAGESEAEGGTDAEGAAVDGAADLDP